MAPRTWCSQGRGRRKQQFLKIYFKQEIAPNFFFNAQNPAREAYSGNSGSPPRKVSPPRQITGYASHMAPCHSHSMSLISVPTELKGVMQLPISHIIQRYHAPIQSDRPTAIKGRKSLLSVPYSHLTPSLGRNPLEFLTNLIWQN